MSDLHAGITETNPEYPDDAGRRAKAYFLSQTEQSKTWRRQRSSATRRLNHGILPELGAYKKRRLSQCGKHTTLVQRLPQSTPLNGSRGPMPIIITAFPAFVRTIHAHCHCRIHDRSTPLTPAATLPLVFLLLFVAPRQSHAVQRMMEPRLLAVRPFTHATRLCYAWQPAQNPSFHTAPLPLGQPT